MKKIDTKEKKADKRASAKRPGISRRVQIYLVGFVAFVTLLLWLFQIVWLDDIYRWEKTRLTRQACQSIAQNLESPRLDRLMEHYASRNDMCIILLSSEYETMVSSSDSRSCLIHRMSTRNLRSWCDLAPDDGSIHLELFNVVIDENTNLYEYNGYVPPIENGQHQSLLCAMKVMLAPDEPAYLLLNTIITPLDTTVATLRIVLAAITAITVVVALAVAWFLARRITRPIVSINEAARALARGQYDPPAAGSAYREMAELNETLTHAAQELSQVEHLQHELIANISHDLRTPLTMIGGYAEVMRDIPGEASPENLQVVIDETNRLNTLVNELLDFSRLQTGHTAMEPVPMCLTDSVRTIIQRVAKLTEKDGYIVRFEPAEQVHVVADDKRMGQVIYNLVGNALTYTGKDRTVTLTQTVKGGVVRLGVSDTGKGIPADEVPLIWNRYYRAKESHKRAVIGSGLGLSIVQSILEKHNANYGVDSVVGQGTTFWFELPIMEENQE